MFNILIFQSLAPTPPELVSACRSDFTRASWLVRQVWKIFQTKKSFNVRKSFRSAWLWGHGLANPYGLGRTGLPHRLRPLPLLPLLPLTPPGHVPPPALLVPPVPPAPGVKYFFLWNIFCNEIFSVPGEHPGPPAQHQRTEHSDTRSVQNIILETEKYLVEIFLFKIILIGSIFSDWILL